MSKEQAKTWIVTEFAQFYLNEQISLIVDSLTEKNFVTDLTAFVTQNKTFAEEEIRKNNPDAADMLIQELGSLNYDMLKETYFILYNQPDPVVPNIIPMNPTGIEYINWLSSDISTLRQYAPDIFAGGLNLNNDNTKTMLEAALKALSEINDDITNLKTILEEINTLGVKK
jgi:hypothetical protein